MDGKFLFVLYLIVIRNTITQMKILLIGEYSNVHNSLKAGLERLGHKVVVASNGDYWKAYPRDINLVRPSGRFAGLRLLLHLLANLHKFRGYDIVQIINPVFNRPKSKTYSTYIQLLASS